MRIPLPAQMQVLHNRNFRLYWTGQFISLTGIWMQAVAQGWAVLVLTGSVAALGVVNFAFAVPSLVLSLTGGVAADRWDRRRIMLITQVALMLVALLMSAVIAADALTFSLLLGASVLTGVASAYDMPAQQALVPDLVSPPEIPQAIAMNQVIFNGSRLLGPALAGIAIAELGLASAYLSNGLSYLAVIASLLLIRLPPSHARGGARGSMLQSLREGLGYVRRSRLLRSLLGLSALAVLLVFPPMAVLTPGYARDVLHGGPGTAGLLMAASGGASMLGAFAMLWIPAHRRGEVMVAAVAGMGLAVAGLAWSGSIWPAMLAAGLLSLGFSMFMGLNMTITQQTVPAALRGRVMSVSGLTFSGVMPFAALAMSFIVARVGFTPVYLVSAAAFVLAGLALLVSSGVIGYIPPQEAPAHIPAAPGAPAQTPPRFAGRPEQPAPPAEAVPRR